MQENLLERESNSNGVASLVSGFMSSSMPGSAKVTLFKISVSTFGKRWRVMKRFSEFKQFYEQVKENQTHAVADIYGKLAHKAQPTSYSQYACHGCEWLIAHVQRSSSAV